MCLISRVGISETIATLAPSPPGTRRASDGIPPAPTALPVWAVLAREGGTTAPHEQAQVAFAGPILLNEGDVQLPSKGRSSAIGTVSGGGRTADFFGMKASMLAPLGLPLGVVVVIELLELVPLELGVGALVAAPDVVVMMAVMVFVLLLVILLHLVRPLLLAQLRLDGLERPGKEAGHNVRRVGIETFAEARHLVEAADTAGFADEDVIEHGRLAKDRKFVSGALLLRIAQGESVEDGTTAYELRGRDFTHERHPGYLRLLSELNTGQGHRQRNGRVAALAIGAVWPVLLAVRGDHWPKKRQMIVRTGWDGSGGGLVSLAAKSNDPIGVDILQQKPDGLRRMIQRDPKLGRVVATVEPFLGVFVPITNVPSYHGRRGG